MREAARERMEEQGCIGPPSSGLTQDCGFYPEWTDEPLEGSVQRRALI